MPTLAPSPFMSRKEEQLESLQANGAVVYLMTEVKEVMSVLTLEDRRLVARKLAERLMRLESELRA